MTYQKQLWVDGETLVNAERLNHIESGIENAANQPGKDGITPILKKGETDLEVSYDNGDSYSTLIPLAEITGPQGPKGEGFSIYKTYASVDAMNADFDNVPEGAFVLIASAEDDADNAKLFVRGSSQFDFLTDLSGAQGIKGENGADGKDGVTPVITVSASTLPAGSEATVEKSGTNENPVFSFGIPAGEQGKQGEPGKDGADGAVPNISINAVSVDEGEEIVVEKSGSAEEPLFLFKFPPSYHPDLSSYVKYTRFSAGADPAERNTIQLANHDSISGVGTDGKGYNLVMLSKWDKADFGSTGVTMNLNSKDGTVQINDEKIVATTEFVEQTCFNPVIVNIPIRELAEQVYERETILGWFGVEDEVALKKLIISRNFLVKYGISLSQNPHQYFLPMQYVAFESDTQIHMVGIALNTEDDVPSKYSITMNLDGTTIDEVNSNVQVLIEPLVKA